MDRKWMCRFFLLSCIAIALLLTSCGRGGGRGETTLLHSQNWAPLEECPNGGITVHSGLDINYNGVLDANEITSTQYVCHGADGGSSAVGPAGPTGPTGPAGADGPAALIAVEIEEPGGNCPYGGYKVNVGLDDNNNLELDPEEIDSFDYVCHGYSADNNPPIADAGPDQRVAAPPRTKVTLDGSGSSDPNDLPLTYQWAFRSRPVNSLAVLSSSTAAAPDFTPDKAGEYELSLEVSNGTTTSLPDTVSVWSGMPIPDTGQTQYHSSTFGDDGDYTINPMSFTDHGDGTILDKVTGLTWQKCSLDQSGPDCATGTATGYTWNNAQSACTTLGAGWRLPTRLELITLVKYGAYNPTIDTAYFPNTPSNLYWSSTTYAPDTLSAWVVYFNFGATSASSKGHLRNVRCVRG